MRQFRGTIDGHYYQIDYPERIAFAYNNNAIVFSSNDDSAFKYSVTVQDNAGYQEARTIEIASFNHFAKADISLLFQLLFETTVIINRDIKATVTIKRGSTTITSFECMVLFAVMNVGDRLQNFGIFSNPNAEHYERHITWFANFPFNISLLGINGATVYKRYDNMPYGTGQAIGSTTEGIQDITPDPDTVQNKFVIKIKQGESTSTFDDTFDYTFFRLGSEDTIIVAERNNAKCGYYFRWLDNRGFWMQYLFDKGFVETTTETDGTSRSFYDEYNGITFESKRLLGIDTTRTIKCCASSLDPERYEDVATIASAAYVDMYLGRTDLGQDIWIPCNVKPATHSKRDKFELNDFEIEVEFIERSQRLW